MKKIFVISIATTTIFFAGCALNNYSLGQDKVLTVVLPDSKKTQFEATVPIAALSKCPYQTLLTKDSAQGDVIKACAESNDTISYKINLHSYLGLKSSSKENPDGTLNVKALPSCPQVNTSILIDDVTSNEELVGLKTKEHFDTGALEVTYIKASVQKGQKLVLEACTSDNENITYRITQVQLGTTIEKIKLPTGIITKETVEVEKTLRGTVTNTMAGSTNQQVENTMASAKHNDNNNTLASAAVTNQDNFAKEVPTPTQNPQSRKKTKGGNSK